ncbi:MAG: helix-turn-helix transcriptional regulator [Firmicutes bacterium]|nr:helix-turn-helix transcriptional regulator [Bacillota bacterium]
MQGLGTRFADLQNMTPHFIKVVERISTPSWRIAEGAYQSHNLILIYDGLMILEAGGQEYTATSGDMVYFRANEQRKARTVNHSLLRCFSVDFLYACLIWDEPGWQLAQPPLPFDTIEPVTDSILFSRLLGLFSDLNKEWHSTKYNRINHCRALFTDIITSLLLTKGGLQVNYDKIQKVERIITYLIDHYRQPIVLADLAQINQISIPYTSKIFKEVTGMTPFEYLSDIRISKAKELLTDGHSVSDTALQVGFTDPAYFSRRFKQKERVSPLHYQLMVRRAHIE